MNTVDRVRADFYAVIDRDAMNISFDGLQPDKTACFVCDARPAAAYGLAKNFVVQVSGLNSKSQYDYFLCDLCLADFENGDYTALADRTIKRKYAEGVIKTSDQEARSRERLHFEFEMMRLIFAGRGMQRFSERSFLLTYRAGFDVGTLPVKTSAADAHAWLSEQEIDYIDDFKTVRREYCRRFSWAIPSNGALAAIARHSPNGVIDYGAGRGYWTYLLRNMGVNAEATELDPHGPGSRMYKAYNKWSGRTYCTIDYGGLRRLSNSDHKKTLLLVWPPEVSDMATEALRNYTGDTVAYVGELWGCTGSDEFHTLLEHEWNMADEVIIPTFYGFFDRLRIYKRKSGAFSTFRTS